MTRKPDKYRSFAELKKGERPKAYRIVRRDRHSPVAVVAPHGGKIERFTSAIARDIARDDLTLYCFEGRKKRHNADLHITSNRFDEPQGIRLMEQANRVVTVHGEKSDAAFVRVGGLDAPRVDALHVALAAAGFVADPPANQNLEGIDPKNICNIGTSHAGVQLEISLGLRKALFGRDGSTAAQANARRAAFCRVVRDALMAG